MTIPTPSPALRSSPRERLEKRLREFLPRSLPGRETAIRLILLDADSYAAWMAERAARPDERWGPSVTCDNTEGIQQ